jgi:hypothetical protein
VTALSLRAAKDTAIDTRTPAATSTSRETYERLAFCERRTLDQHVYYTIDYVPVRKLTRKLEGPVFLKRVHG